MGKEQISSGQLFVLIFLFEMGTSIVLPIGFSNQKDLWISISIASIGGILLFLLYHYLFLEYPELPLSRYARKILGRELGWIVSILYGTFFIYNGSRDLREGGELLVNTVYNQTPLLVIETMLLIVVIYALHKGIEVLARMAELYFVVLLFLGGLGIIIVLFANIIHLENLEPILENGWKPVIKTAFPNISMFPFGELICFTTIFPFLKKKQTEKKVGIAAIMFSTLTLIFIHTLEISVLGENVYRDSPFPLLRMIQKASIGDFIERLDIFAIIILIIGDFYKISLYCLSAITIVSDVFNIPDNRKVIWPIASLILFSSITEASTLAEHFEEGDIVIRIFLPLLSVGIPGLMVTIHLFRKRLFLSKTDGENS